jgi:hypothetical protein
MFRSLSGKRSIVDNLQKTIDSKNRGCLDWRQFLSPLSQAWDLV